MRFEEAIDVSHEVANRAAKPHESWPAPAQPPCAERGHGQAKHLGGFVVRERLGPMSIHDTVLQYVGHHARAKVGLPAGSVKAASATRAERSDEP